MATNICADFCQWIRAQPRLMLVLEAVERREVKPSILHRVLGPRLSYRKGLSIGNPILLFINLNICFGPLRLYTTPNKIKM